MIRRKNGYSLIELLVVMAVMGILMSAGVFTFRLANAKRNLNEAAEKVREQIELVKTETAAPSQEIADSELTNDNSATSYYNGYRIIFDAGSANNQIIKVMRAYQNGGNLNTPVIQQKELRVIHLPSGVLVKEICFDNASCISSTTLSDQTAGIHFRFNNNRVTFGQTYLISQGNPFGSNVANFKLILQNSIIAREKAVIFYPLTGTTIIRDN